MVASFTKSNLSFIAKLHSACCSRVCKNFLVEEFRQYMATQLELSSMATTGLEPVTQGL